MVTEEKQNETFTPYELVTLFPDKYRNDISCGIPEEVRGKCGPICSEGRQKCADETGHDIVVATPTAENRTNHSFLYDRDTNEIIDPTAGQYIPLHARIKGFYGNLFKGTEEDLYECVQLGFEGITPLEHESAWELISRIWGVDRKSKEFMKTPQEFAKITKDYIEDLTPEEMAQMPDWLK